MENLERPLTLGLAIVLLGYLLIANSQIGQGDNCTINNSFNISSAKINALALEVDMPEIIEEELVEEILFDSNAVIVIVNDTNVDGTNIEPLIIEEE